MAHHFYSHFHSIALAPRSVHAGKAALSQQVQHGVVLREEWPLFIALQTAVGSHTRRTLPVWSYRSLSSFVDALYPFSSARRPHSYVPTYTQSFISVATVYNSSSYQFSFLSPPASIQNLAHGQSSIQILRMLSVSMGVTHWSRGVVMRHLANSTCCAELTFYRRIF